LIIRGRESGSRIQVKLNSSKTKIVTEESRVRPAKVGETPILRLSFDYLGYTFSVYDPQQKPKNLKAGLHSRAVTVDIAKTKVKKLKTRIIRSFLDFKKNGNFSILLDRVKFLTQNFSVYNSKVGSQKLAGIFHSYPQVTDDASSLIELDQFLKHATLSKSGRLFSNTSGMLSSLQKRQLLAHSFVRGHADKSFVHFSAVRISEIQKCWLY
jgi:hypothetical protein